jgi:REP element-mobilizing transposase RayT
MKQDRQDCLSSTGCSEACVPRDNRLVPIGNDTFATRRHLPHFEKNGRTYFVTFTTMNRMVLPEAARDIVLACCTHDHDLTYWLHTAVVMPDHVHMLFTPLEEWTLSRIMRRVKGVSSRHINQLLTRTGPLWQDESFDRILRSDEDVRRTGEYIAENPVRAGLVKSADEYPWLCREWIEVK